MQNFLVVWLDDSFNHVENQDCQNRISLLHEIVKDVHIFTDVDRCVEFISTVEEEEVFIISSGAFVQTTGHVIHNMPQVAKIYIFCDTQAEHEQWTDNSSKIGGVFTDIKSICIALRKATQACDPNSLSISFIAPNAGTDTPKLDELDQSFMYTQIMKEILLTIDFDQSHFQDFIKNFRELHAHDEIRLKTIDTVEHEYNQHTPIWWYTSETLFYSTLNHALRLMEVDHIVSMGFFVRALHDHIVKLRAEQLNRPEYSAPFTVYRGQGFHKKTFDLLRTMKGGLLSFNNFLSTSTKREVSVMYASGQKEVSDIVGVLFVIDIDPSTSSVPFANIRNVSQFDEEEEILFSMHSIFRIEQITLDENDNVWEVALTLTSDDDLQLRDLTNHIRKETTQPTGWHRLAQLMIKLGQMKQAERLYETLLKQTVSEREEAFLYHQLGWIKDDQGDYASAVTFYEKSIELNLKLLPSSGPALCADYCNIGGAYFNMKSYDRALLYFKDSLEIAQNILPPGDSRLATSYNNIGLTYDKLDESSEALSYYLKSLEIDQKNLPSNHPDLAITYNNIGLAYFRTERNQKALLFYEESLRILEKSLPQTHPILADCYNNMGSLYFKKGNFSKALSFFELTLSIRQIALPPSHPHLQETSEWIESVKKKL